MRASAARVRKNPPGTSAQLSFRAAVALAAALLAAGCLSAGGTGPGGIGPATAGLIGAKPKPAAPKPAPAAAATAPAGAGAEALQRAVALVAAATPSSLAAAQWASQDATRSGAADGAAAGAAAGALSSALYPDPAAKAAPAASTAVSPRTISDPFLQKIVPALIVLDPSAAVDDASDLEQKLGDAAAMRKDSPLAPYLLGVLLERTYASPAERRAQFEECLKRLPSFMPAVTKLLDTIIASGGAAKELPYLERLAAMLPTSADRYDALVRAGMAAGQPGMAADAAARGLLEAPDGASGAAIRVHFAVLRAAALEAAGDWYQSLSVLEALLKLEPGQPDATLAKARILHRDARDDASALALLTDAEAGDPKNAAYPEMKARILLDAGKIEEARAEAGHAHDMDPGSVSVLTLLAEVSAGAGTWDDAASWLSQVPAGSVGPEQLRLAWRIQTALGSHDKALAAAGRLYQSTGDTSALALEARSMIAAGRPADARVVIDHALNAQDPAPELASELHTIRAGAGSADPMLDLRTALKENPDNVEALVAISDALAAQKDYRKAMEYARRASVLEPSNADLAQKAASLARQAATQSSASE